LVVFCVVFGGRSRCTLTVGIRKVPRWRGVARSVSVPIGHWREVKVNELNLVRQKADDDVANSIRQV
jgi:hypothetical protein